MWNEEFVQKSWNLSTEVVECNLRGQTVFLILFVIPINSVYKFVIPSKDEQYTYRLFILTGITVQQIGLHTKEGITSATIHIFV